MIDLGFEVDGGRAVPYASVPTLGFDLRVGETTGARIHTMVLHCQVRIEPAQRRYEPSEQGKLSDLFGEPSRWADTAKPFPWTETTVTVPGFTGEREIDVRLECSYDLEVTAGKYFAGLEDGDIPLLFLFSGTVFLRDGSGISVEQIPWDREARYRLPVAAWQEMVDTYWPGSGWLRLDRETIDGLRAYKSRHAIPTWDGAVRRAIDEADRSELGVDV